MQSLSNSRAESFSGSANYNSYISGQAYSGSQTPVWEPAWDKNSVLSFRRLTLCVLRETEFLAQLHSQTEFGNEADTYQTRACTFWHIGNILDRTHGFLIETVN